MNVQKKLTAVFLLCGVILADSAFAKSKIQSAKPCSMLTESLIRETLSIPTDTEIVQDDNTDSHFPNCGYRWRVMSEADEQAAKARNTEKMMANIKAGRSPNEGLNHNIPSHASMGLTVVDFDSAEDAQSGLESAKSYLIGRAKQKGKEPMPWDVVDDVGEIAYYHNTQLSYASGRQLMHLNASPVETAKTLAIRIIEQR